MYNFVFGKNKAKLESEIREIDVALYKPTEEAIRNILSKCKERVTEISQNVSDSKQTELVEESS